MSSRLLKFDQMSFKERPLGESVDPSVTALIMALSQKRLFFVTGAGVSAASPTTLPTGKQLALALVGWLRGKGMTDVVAQISVAEDLGEVCAVIERESTRNSLNRLLLDSADWKKAPVNMCHLSLALLFAEGPLKRSFTFNWDDKVAEASSFIEQSDLSCPVDIPTLEVASDPMFVHLHGHIDHPDRFVATSDDLEGSPLWIEPSLGAAIHEAEVVFVGFAAEPKYLVESLQQVAKLADKPPLAIVTIDSPSEFVSSAPELAKICGLGDEDSPTRYMQMDAREMFGELLRAFYRGTSSGILDSAIDRAAKVASAHDCPSPESKQWLPDLILGKPLDAFLRFTAEIPALASDSAEGHGYMPMSPISDEWIDAITALLILASCSDAAGLDNAGSGFRLKKTDGKSVDLLPVISVRDQYLVTACSNARENSGAFGNPGDSDIPVVLVVQGGYGRPLLGHTSLVADEKVGSLVKPARPVVAAVSLGVLQERLEDVAAGARPSFSELVTPEVNNG